MKLKLKLIASGLLALASLTVHAQSWNVAGNTVTAGNFLGSINNIDVEFKRFGYKAGLLGANNTAFGVLSLNANTGVLNTATGFSSLKYTTTGTHNTAMGSYSLLANVGGVNNTAMGASALDHVTSGNYNTGSGSLAGTSNTTGSNNSYFGYNTGVGVSTGSYNTILGANVTGLAAGLSNTIILADGAGNQRLHINNLGNAGIGTTTPGARLEVNSGAAGTAGLKFTQLTSSSATLAANGKALSVDATGKVILVPASSAATGWGLTGNSITAANFLGSSNNVDIVFKRNGLKAGLLNDSSHNTSFGVSALRDATTSTFNTAVGKEALLLNTTGTGNVAIGVATLPYTSTGGSNTGVGTNAGFDNTSGNYNTYLGWNTGRGITTGSYNTIVGSYVTGLPANLSNTIILADGAGNQRLRIDATGKTIIGSPTLATPGTYKLYVETGILTEKVSVAVKTSADWADHVFNKTYDLLPLNQLEQYIQTYKHLPNIPSAAQVVKEGIDLGQMDAKLLSKIEELTLYMIEMKKENEKHQKLIESMNKKSELQDKKIEKLEQENATLKTAINHSQKQ